MQYFIISCIHISLVEEDLERSKVLASIVQLLGILATTRNDKDTLITAAATRSLP